MENKVNRKTKNVDLVTKTLLTSLISLMIGVNDFCSNMCWNSSPSSIFDKHKADLLQVLTTLRDNLPRTLISLIPSQHMKTLFDSRKGRPSFTCDLMTDSECSCIWQELDMEILNIYFEFQRDDFAVITQAITLDLSIPLVSHGYADTTYFTIDCFHDSQKTNTRIANGLWNNLLEPVGVKTKSWQDLFERFLCPTPERPYLATLQNSQIDLQRNKSSL
ncbi:PREDICTED: phospholipase B1, membrane-associated-like [Dinoponera quadriceps]|uniref:Phospholipase B1, membrane-associated-like n=1 Tax=Dinoponera quadriceps TaxID=609295 RepID=A0A6P3WND9_DINQU|nr:PREDICTED: phospholipase B1, membrane-associated-like [Dinoponera quadriceps]